MCDTCGCNVTPAADEHAVEVLQGLPELQHHVLGQPDVSQVHVLQLLAALEHCGEALDRELRSLCELCVSLVPLQG